MIFPNQTLWVKSYITIMNLKFSTTNYLNFETKPWENWDIISLSNQNKMVNDWRTLRQKFLRGLFTGHCTRWKFGIGFIRDFQGWGLQFPYSFNVPDELAHLTWWILKIRNENPCTFGTSTRAPGLLEPAQHWENTNLFQNISSQNYYKTYWIFHEFDQNTPQFSRKIRNAEKLQWINSTKLLQQSTSKYTQESVTKREQNKSTITRRRSCPIEKENQQPRLKWYF